MYKTGDKFIIEIGGVYHGNPRNLYRIRYFDSLTFDESELDKLDKYVEAFSSAKSKDYEKGLSDAWECVRKIVKAKQGELHLIFPGSDYDDFDLDWVDDYTAREAIQKMEEWEESKEIMVGDVVKIKNVEGNYVVTFANGELFHCMSLISGTFCIKNYDHVKKTGRHIDLTEIFKGLEEEDADRTRGKSR